MNSLVLVVLITLGPSVGICCSLAYGSPWNQPQKHYYRNAPSIYVVEVLKVEPDPKDKYLTKTTFKTIRMIKGRAESQTFSRSYVSGAVEKAAYGPDCKTSLEFKVGKKYIYVPDFDGVYMVDVYSEKREKEIKAILERQ